ncbi:MAG: amidohydrolase family protein [Dehalococcoidia bacterium]
MIIDFHTHVFPPQMRDNRERYIGSDPLFARIYANPKAKIADCDGLIAKMDEEGIDRAVVMNANWSSLWLVQETNDYILESIARYPKRLVGFCSLPPTNDKERIAELERCVRAGIRGIGEMRPEFQGLDKGDEPVLDSVIKIALQHKLMLCIHASEPVGHDYPGKYTFTPEKIYRLILRYPELTMILAHWGGGMPFYALMPEVKTAMKNTYVDTSASPYLYTPEIFTHVSRIIGADKILFGSDFPLMPPSKVLKQMNATELSEKEKALILHGNAERLL